MMKSRAIKSYVKQWQIVDRHNSTRDDEDTRRKSKLTGQVIKL